MACVEDLGVGVHACTLFEGDEEWLDSVAVFVRVGLERGERVLYIMDGHAQDELIAMLEETGFDLQDARRLDTLPTVLRAVAR